MTAVRRMAVKISKSLAALALLLSAPALAQNSDAPVDVTAAPPPSNETIGPAQLRDFNLNGTVTRPADRPNTTAPNPAPRGTQGSSASPTATTPAADPSTVTTRRATPSLPSAQNLSPVPSSGGQAAIPADPEAVTPAPEGVQTGSATSSTFGEDDLSTDLPAPGSGLGWPWILALLALAGGAAFIILSRRSRRQRYGDPGRMAFAGLVPDDLPDHAPAALPPARPRHDPRPPRASPKPASPASAPAAAPQPKPSDAGLIVSTRLKPQLAVQFQPDRAVITDSDVMLQFDVVVTNSGSAPARDVLVEAQLVCAHSGQDAEIGAFFQKPAGKGDRIAVIQPLGRLALKSSVRLPLSQVKSFQVEGRTLFVPLVAFNLHYSGDLQTSASFLVGRGTEEDEKLAPFRLDLGPRIFRGLSARSHSMGLSKAA